MSEENRSIPAYIRIKEDLLSKIVSGELKPGEQLLTEPVLAKKYSVSRMTLRQALTELEKNNYLYRIHGKGTFVQKPRIERDSEAFKGFLKDMQEKGFPVYSKTLVKEIILPNPEQVKSLGCGRQTALAHIKRIRYISSGPLVVQESFIPESMVPGFMNINFDTHSLYDYLKKECGVEIIRAREKLNAILSDHPLSTYLELEDRSPILFIERLAYSRDERPVELSLNYFRADSYTFEVELSKN